MKEPTQKQFPNDPQDVSLCNAWNSLQVDSVVEIFILWAGGVSTFLGCEYFLLQHPVQIKIIIVLTLQVIIMIQIGFQSMI